MNDANATAHKSRSLALEFGLYFCLGFALMAAYWLFSDAPAARTDPLLAAAVIHGAPLLSAGRKRSAIETLQKEPSSTTAGTLPSKRIEGAKIRESLDGEMKNGAEDESYQYLSFEKLGGYLYEPPDPEGTVEIPGLPKTKNEIPDSIKAFHGKKVHLQGFMVPTRIEKGAVKAFVLCQTLPQCCFGDSLRMNQWIIVKMAGDKSATYVADQAVMVWGKLDVGELIDQGVVLSLYRFEAEQVSGPPEL